MVVIVAVYTLFVTSKYDVIFTFANQCFGEVVLSQYAYYSTRTLVVAQCVTVMNINSALEVRRLEQNIALSAKTEHFLTAKISGNALKHGHATHSVLRQRS